ncbi:NTP transferase domain-containing protein [Streptomyces sp. SM12]|uniref:nucleotidyltransferase family protein n=1 Tax=Streptomyces sp. SM12 TaxID=1071602 RepID=UPI000CD50071|nr:nucleotidyltransferase family protein [Streptomyces sp. SM12]
MNAKIAGVLLAAGGGRRLGGRPKALLDDGGVLFVERAAARLVAAGCAPVRVVVGASAQEVRSRARLPGCALVENPAWESGMASSLRVGLAELPAGTDAVLVSLVDQPGIGTSALRRVMAAYSGRRTLAAAGYGGRRGHPVLIGVDHLAGVSRTAQGDEGARRFLLEHETDISVVDCGDIASPQDVDTPSELRKLAASWGAAGGSAMS